MKDAAGKFWPADEPLQATSAADRISPAIHFSRHGFTPDAPKFAFVAYDLGTLGEMDLPGEPLSRLIDADGKEVFLASLDSFPFYERSATDAYNVREEWNVGTGARLLAGHLFLMARTPAAAKDWVPKPAIIEGIPDKVRVGDKLRATLSLPEGTSSRDATIVWEWIAHEPASGEVFFARADNPGPARLEAEIIWPDGRRLAAAHRFEIVK